jgi:hypothetical protein
MESREIKIGDRVVMKMNLGRYSNKKGVIVGIDLSSERQYNIYHILILDLSKEYFHFYRERFELLSKVIYHYGI